MTEFIELPWYYQAAVLYLSLWSIKMLITVRELSYIANMRVEAGVVEIPKGWSIRRYKSLMWVMYTIGAGAALLVLLLPTLWKEGLQFFKAYSREQIEHFTITEKWKD